MKTFAVLNIFFVLFFTAAKADKVSLNAFGNRVSFSGEFGSEKLSVNGKIMIEAGHVDLEEMVLHAGVPIMIGSTSPGGNYCDSSPFVLSFPKDSPPRLDGPIDTCRAPTYKIEPDRIIFMSTATPFFPGQEWIWTLADGFS